jgi:7-cyano-7-deazaguanine synthase
MRKKAVILASGGVDSTTLLYDIKNRGYEVHALSVHYNQRHSRELTYIKKTCKKLKIPHKIIDISVISKHLLGKNALTSKKISVPAGDYKTANMKLTVVPNRNMILLSLVSGYAITIGAGKVFYGAHTGDHAIYPDCRKVFVQALARAIQLAHWNPVKLEAPYLHLSKADIVKRGIKLGVDYSLTWSCYEGGKIACGKCGTCRERLTAFKKSGRVDPVKYKV